MNDILTVAWEDASQLYYIWAASKLYYIWAESQTANCFCFQPQLLCARSTRDVNGSFVTVISDRSRDSGAKRFAARLPLTLAVSVREYLRLCTVRYES